MFIFGWGTRQRVVDTGRFQCPVCKTETPARQLRDRRWMTFFFIPVIPLSSSQNFLRCDRCQTTIPREMLAGQNAAAGKAEMSQLAIVGMVLGILACLTICIFFFSIPLAITAIILGHVGLSQIRKNKPQMEGGWQAITALATGYSALLLSITIFCLAVMLPRLVPPNDPRWARNKADSGQEDGPFSISASTSAAFSSAESEIASKQGKPAGRGNSPEAIKLATEYAERIKELSDEAFTSNGRPLLQLSGGEYLTFCELHEDRCLFLVHVPSYRKFTDDAKKTLAELAWAVAQVEVAGKMPANSKLGVGLRGVLQYGDIMLGTCPASSEDKYTTYRSGKESDLLAFFERESQQSNASTPMANSEKSAPGQLDPETVQPEKATPNSEQATQRNENMLAGPTTAEKPADNPQAIERPNASNNQAMATADPFSAAPSALPPTAPPSSMANSNSDRERRPSKVKIDFENQVPVRLTTTIANPLWAFKSLAFSPDGKWLAAGKADEVMCIFDARSGEEVHKLEKLTDLGQVTALAYSANGDYLAAGGDRGQVMCWKVGTDGSLTANQLQHRFESAVEGLITSPKHPFFMGANRKGTIAWQSMGPNKSQPRLLQEFPRNVFALWLPLSGTDAMATDGMKLLTFSLREGEITASKDLGVKDSRCAAFSPSGKRLVIAGFDNWHFIDLENSNRRRTLKAPRGDMIHSLLFHKNEHWIATGMRGKIALLDFDKGEIIAYADPDANTYQDSLAFSNDGQYLAACSENAQAPIKIFQLGQ